jgi:succinoglycan biosynthesis protein ExoO
VLRIADLQDVLSVHARRHGEVTGTPGAFSLSEATERFLWTQWDVLLAITQDDVALIAPHRRPSQCLMAVPHATPVIDGPEGDPNRFVYIGSDNAANRHAVTWLLAHVWPRVVATRPRARLRLVGLICETLRATPLASAPGLELAGFVDAPGDELTSGALSVAPYLFGSGLKIKVVEAAAAGRAIVTTPMGLEGTDMRHGEHLLVAESSEAFADAMLTLLDDHGLRRRVMSGAREHASRTFSPPACYGPLLDVLQRQERSKETCV